MTYLWGFRVKLKNIEKKHYMQKNPLKSVNKGDIWQLGDHRLACGSASDSDLVKKVAGGGRINQILCDPPYGVAYVENKAHFKETIGTNISHPQEIIGDQCQSDENYSEFTKNWLLAIAPFLEKYNTAYIFNSDLMICALRSGMKAAGFYYSQMIIWLKNTAIVGRKDYMPQHELIIYGWRGRHKMEHGKDKSVMFYPKPHESKLHPTMKPVGLLRRLILNSTKIGQTVYDPFLGSGSTLIACEHTKRKCVGIEIDPGYCATIIKRWEILTGKEAKKIS
jgi:DNA modification methylase